MITKQAVQDNEQYIYGNIFEKYGFSAAIYPANFIVGEQGKVYQLDFIGPCTPFDAVALQWKNTYGLTGLMKDSVVRSQMKDAKRFRERLLDGTERMLFGNAPAGLHERISRTWDRWRPNFDFNLNNSKKIMRKLDRAQKEYFY